MKDSWPEDFRNVFCDEVLNTCVDMKGQLLLLRNKCRKCRARKVFGRSMVGDFRKMNTRISSLEKAVKHLKETADDS